VINRDRAESRWYDVDGAQWHARTSEGAGKRGDRPAVVLIQGLVISSTFHVPLIDQLSENFDVYAPDLPGYGNTEDPGWVLKIPELADRVARWLVVAGLQPANLLGVSFGCQIVAETARRHPEAVERAVLVGPVVEPAVRPLWKLTGSWLIEAPQEGPMAPLHVRDIARAGLPRAIKTLQMMRNYRLDHTVREVTAPTLVVRGSRDPIVSQQWVEKLTRLLPDGQLRVLPGAPHAANFTEPLQLARVVSPFLLERRGRAAATA
jgi:2-hydroxy-6-oxonona-2,4-dienedioate hydrolase